MGRDDELSVLDGFLTTSGNPRALMLTGGTGIGKTVLWEAAVSIARQQGIRVLTTRGSSAEKQLSFAALIDFLDDVDLGELEALPSPQLHALEVALLRAEPERDPFAPPAINVGFLNALRALAGREPLLVALDDVQWLDAASVEARVFASGLYAVGLRFQHRRKSHFIGGVGEDARYVADRIVAAEQPSVGEAVAA